MARLKVYFFHWVAITLWAASAKSQQCFTDGVFQYTVDSYFTYATGDSTVSITSIDRSTRPILYCLMIHSSFPTQ